MTSSRIDVRIGIDAGDGDLEANARRMLLADAGRVGLAGPYEFMSWRPNSNRKHKIRRFVTLYATGTPRLVAKMRTEADDLKVGREYRVLCQLAENPSWRGAQPGSASGQGFVMAFAPHRDFPEFFSRRGFADRRRLACAVVTDIWAFHRSGTAPAVRRTEQHLTDILGSWRPGEGSAASALAAVPAGAMHGDLGPWNIRIGDSERLTIIDWEDYRSIGVPALDVLNFLLTLTLLVHPDHASLPPGALYEKTFLDRGEMAGLLGEGLRHYAQLSGVGAELCLALVPVYCRAMLRRFELEQRPTSHLFYIPFQERFHLEDCLWIVR